MKNWKQTRGLDGTANFLGMHHEKTSTEWFQRCLI
jgi:hypothetical protein